METDKSQAPSHEEVLREVFRDNGNGDDREFILFNNGTFYTFPKVPVAQQKPGWERELLARALDLSTKADLINYDDCDCTTLYPIREFSHPSYIVLSCLGQNLGWVIVGATPQWAQGEKQEAAVCYLARAKYELDCQEGKIVATSFGKTE